MVGTITPVVNRGNKVKQIFLTIAPHLIGYLIGAMALGLLCGICGNLLFGWWGAFNRVSMVFPLVGLFGLAMALGEINLIRLPRPQCRWQVPARWRSDSYPGLTTLIYGIVLGFGLLNRITVNSFYVALLCTVLVGGPTWGMICLSLFGVGRILPILLISLMRQEAVFRLTPVIDSYKPVVHVVNSYVTGFLASMLLIKWLLT